jgi:Ran GTPase-activating protein 1
MGTDFALQGKGHRLDAREDVEPLLEKLKADDKVESVSFSENTLGVGACEAIGEVLRSKKSIKVRLAYSDTLISFS